MGRQPKWYLTIVGGLIVSFIFIKPVSAQLSSPVTGIDLTLSPVFLNIATPPGTSIEKEIKVRNNGLNTDKITIGLMRFTAYNDQGQPLLYDLEPDDPVKNWITYPSGEIDLPPNQWKTLSIAFDIPSDAALGYYYALTFQRAGGAPLAGEKQTSLYGTASILLLLDVQVPGANRRIDIADFSVDRRFYDYLPVTFRLQLRNGGNIHVAPYGNIFIERGKQKDVAVLEVNPGQGNILPQSERVFTTEWKDGSPVYVAKQEDGKVVTDSTGRIQRDWHWSFSELDKLRWGKYTAHLLLVYDDGQKDIPIEGTVTFWVFPWQLALSALAALFILYNLKSIMQWIKRRLKRKTNRVTP